MSEDTGRIDLKLMVKLTIATVGFSTGITVVTTYLPLILRHFTNSATLIGFAIGGEGVFALAIPLVVGVISDSIWTKWGRRRPFMIVSAPFMASALVLAPFQPGYVPIAIVTFVFFAGYHFYTSPYQSLIPDTTPSRLHGRTLGMQNSMRGIGIFFGSVLAGVFYARWAPLPFILSAVLIMVVTYITVATIGEQRPVDSVRISRNGFWGHARGIWASMRQQKGLPSFLIANYLWEFTIAGFRPFAMLFFLYAFGANTDTGALLLFEVGVMYVFAGLISGYLADRYGRKRVIMIGLWIYLIGCVSGYFINSATIAFLVLPIFGLGGSTVLTLPYVLLMKMMPKEQVGQFTGMFTLSRGLATITAPVITGGVIDAVAPFLPETRGYNVIWPLAGVAVLISIILMRNVKVD